MYVQQVHNVNQALASTLKYLSENGEEEESRNGTVLVAPGPICTVTSHPCERVLFSPIRDANPFFHLFEAIWMLYGSDNGKSLDRYIQNFSKMFGEDDGTIHGAYGHRWRSHFGFDQLDTVVQILNEVPTSRQCVIQMWDCFQDRGNDLRGTWKDKPCNDVIFLRNNNEQLDMTICCRSNDMIWGAHGANAVHFSILQEYLAARLDLGIGVMIQFSNNAHVYIDILEKLQEASNSPNDLCDDRYSHNLKPMPMFTDPDHIDDDINRFMLADIDYQRTIEVTFYNEWFLSTLTPAMLAHRAFKIKDYKMALQMSNQVAAMDWRIACTEWIERRVK